jgi:hypothetical protein
MTFLYSLLAALLLQLPLQSDPVYNSIERSFNANTTTEIASLCKDKLLLTILGKENIYSVSQANLVLKDFFTAHPDGTFKFTFKGKESENGSFSIGTYETKTGDFRITIHLKRYNGNFRIESLSIEKI